MNCLRLLRITGIALAEVHKTSKSITLRASHRETLNVSELLCCNQLHIAQLTGKGNKRVAV
jgi:hypothetical protein